jgi:hypothetical protein
MAVLGAAGVELLVLIVQLSCSNSSFRVIWELWSHWFSVCGLAFLLFGASCGRTAAGPPALQRQHPVPRIKLESASALLSSYVVAAFMPIHVQPSHNGAISSACCSYVIL